MKLKIRINELARELEVKPNVILDLLPDFGVQEKKTHSSSIDEDVAAAIKHRLGGASGVAERASERGGAALALEDYGDEDHHEQDGAHHEDGDGARSSARNGGPAEAP